MQGAGAATRRPAPPLQRFARRVTLAVSCALAAALLPHGTVLAQSSGGASWFAPPKAPQPYPARTRPAPPTSSGGIFNFLFGAPNRDLYRRPGSYERGQDRYYSPSYTEEPHSYGRYRTMCVRLCDGFYFPISDATTRSGFKRDAQRCESSCSSPARLFFHSAYGGSPNSMIDLQGKPYRSIENAFLYRTKYLPDCRCKPDPWSEEAKQEYARRATAELQKVAEKAVEPETAPEPPAAQALSVPTASRPRPARRESGWKSFLPFGRWSNGS
ncbi:MAG: hypothetical protein Kow0032_09680 [Methyloligellaceae bacterium]